MNSLDFSFDAAKVTQQWAADRIANGWELAIVGAWTGNQMIPGCEHALKVWREAGGLTALYFVVHDGRPVPEHFGKALAASASEWAHLKFVAVDVEVDPTSPATVDAACKLVRAYNQRPVVYTSRGLWQDLCGNTALLSDVPLWDASWGQTPSLTISPAYGGWTRRTGHQHAADVNLGGIHVDYNIFDPLWVIKQENTDQDWETVINVTRGFGQEFSQAWDRMTMKQVADRMREAGKQLNDVAQILERLRAASGRR